MNNPIDNLSINTIRLLVAEGVRRPSPATRPAHGQRGHRLHPWEKHMKHNPADVHLGRPRPFSCSAPAMARC
jgi:hypothetical protein